jgi:hypothetical protein
MKTVAQAAATASVLMRKGKKRMRQDLVRPEEMALCLRAKGAILCESERTGGGGKEVARGGVVRVLDHSQPQQP